LNNSLRYTQLKNLHWGVSMEFDIHTQKQFFNGTPPESSGNRSLLIKRLDPTQRATYDPTEITALAETLGYRILDVIVQRAWPRSPFIIGSGKIEEIKELIEEYNIDQILFDDHLDPSSFFHLEQTLGLPVVDRYHLILQIFECHSHDRVSKLQIELARLHYEMPRYAEFVKRNLSGREHPGFRSSGTYRVDDYERMIKRRMANIRVKLDKIRNERQIRRKKRDRSGFNIVSLAGYYNAGKSSLHRTLTGSDALVSAAPFSTLSTKIRRADKQILINDTVGFIDNLPLEFMEAFRSTLEEISSADLILLVLDISDDLKQVEHKLNTCQQILAELDTSETMIYVLCKSDLLDNNFEKKAALEQLFEGKSYVFVSNKTSDGVVQLKSMIKTLLSR